MNKITICFRVDFNNFKKKLSTLIPDKALKFDVWQSPPKEYKSSKYRVWIDYGLSEPNDLGTVMSCYKFYFRDEEDYMLALLMK